MEKAVIDTNVSVNFFLNTELTEKAYNLVKFLKKFNVSVFESKFSFEDF